MTFLPSHRRSPHLRALGPENQCRQGVDGHILYLHSRYNHDWRSLRASITTCVLSRVYEHHQ
jgi:hypothetical protein